MTLRDKIAAAALDAIAEFAGEVRDALIGEHRTAAEEPDRVREHPDSPEVTARTWRPVFASNVREQALIAVDGRYVNAAPGRRALRVAERRTGEHAGMFGTTRDAITFLVTDIETGRSDSLTVTPDAALDVAVEVPDTVPADLGGAS